MLSSFVICRSVPAILAVADIALRGTLGTNTLNDGYLTAHAAATPDLVQIMHMGTALPLQMTVLLVHGQLACSDYLKARILRAANISMQLAMKGCAGHPGRCLPVLLPGMSVAI